MKNPSSFPTAAAVHTTRIHSTTYKTENSNELRTEIFRLTQPTDQYAACATDTVPNRFSGVTNIAVTSIRREIKSDTTPWSHFRTEDNTPSKSRETRHISENELLIDRSTDIDALRKAEQNEVSFQKEIDGSRPYIRLQIESIEQRNKTYRIRGDRFILSASDKSSVNLTYPCQIIACATIKSTRPARKSWKIIPMHSDSSYCFRRLMKKIIMRTSHPTTIFSMTQNQ